MIDLIQETSGGFKSSQNQRLDAELCLMHLCQPELTVDAPGSGSQNQPGGG